jgi:hypothetical protein
MPGGRTSSHSSVAQHTVATMMVMVMMMTVAITTKNHLRLERGYAGGGGKSGRILSVRLWLWL